MSHFNFNWSNQLVQAAYLLLGFIVNLWIMGVIGTWESPIFRLCNFLLVPKGVPLSATPRNVVRIASGGLAAMLLMFASFIFWPIAALFTLAWLAWPRPTLIKTLFRWMEFSFADRRKKAKEMSLEALEIVATAVENEAKAIRKDFLKRLDERKTHPPATC